MCDGKLEMGVKSVLRRQTNQQYLCKRMPNSTASKLHQHTNNNNNPYWYVDLGEEMSINDVALMGCTDKNWGQLTDGTYIGVSTTECWSTEEGCMETTTGVTVCGILVPNSWKPNKQYHVSCSGKQENNSITEGAIGRYVFVWGNYKNHLVLCEVLAMGSPLFYEKLNGLNDAEISSAPTPASNTSLPTLLPTPAPTSIRALKTLTSNVRYTVLDNDRLFLTWDSALDKCQRYGMSPATVRSMAEQAALSAAFYAYHKEHSLDYDNITETLQYSWLGGVYEEDSNSL